MLSFVSDHASMSVHSLPAKHPSLSDVKCALWHVAAHLSLPEIYHLCATTKDILPFGSLESENEFWCSAANRTHVGFQIVGVEKSIVKKLLRMARGVMVIDSEPVRVSSAQGAKTITHAISHAESKNLIHMREGGSLSQTFVTRFFFPDDGLEDWLSEPGTKVISWANPFPVGDAVLFLSLSFKRGKVSVFAEQEAYRRAERVSQDIVPLLISIRALSSSVLLRQDLTLDAQGRCDACGLFSLGPAQSAAKVLEQGLQCVVSVRDAVATVALRPPSRTLNSLHLDENSRDEARRM